MPSCFFVWLAALACCLSAEQFSTLDPPLDATLVSASDATLQQLKCVALLQTRRTRRRFCDPVVELSLSLPFVQEATPGNITPAVPLKEVLQPTEQTSIEVNMGSLHEIVGTDGVLMITLQREPIKSQVAAKLLHRVGIFPTAFPATDDSCASPETLSRGCEAMGDSWRTPLLPPPPGSCDAKHRGLGCRNTKEQALADSHRRALELALRRDENWTAIFEDDAVPVLPETGNWNSEFKRVWATVPIGVLMVRLSWCFAPQTPLMQNTPNGTFQVFHPGANIGGCTSAYMVHKQLIPRLLNVFPCCGPVDACYEWDFARKVDPTNPLGQHYSNYMIMDMDVGGSVEYIRRRHNNSFDVQQRGVIMQDRELLRSRSGD